ncbi:MAG: antitermination protein NusG [Planctomycetia bacterium]|nr:antitermination protein NusG [Planctomycetia bacterium]
MPILPKQRDINPPWLLEDPLGTVVDREPRRADARWLAFYTLSRREKDLMRKLESAAIPFYAPVIKRRLRSPGGRTRISHVPLFPGYVFSLVDDDQRRAALATNTIARWLPIADDRRLLADLRSIKRLIDADRPLTPEARLEAGQDVRVRSGPLRGIEGTVIRRRGEERLQVAVQFLGQGASIEVEDVDLERL